MVSRIDFYPVFGWASSLISEVTTYQLQVLDWRFGLLGLWPAWLLVICRAGQFQACLRG